MNIGDLDRRIQFQTRNQAENADGSPSSGWVTTRTTWARRRDLRGSGSMAGNRQIDSQLTEFMVRYFPGATGAERIVDENGAHYIVKGPPAELGHREFLTFTAERGGVT